MDIRNPLSNRLRQLRWKLALSYTGVTVAALIVVELCVFLASGTYLVNLLDSGVIPSRMIEAATIEYVPVLRLYLEQSPPDQGGIAVWLERFRNSPTLLQGTGSIPVIIDPGELELVLLGPDGSFLGASSPALENGMNGHPLDVQATPGLAGVLQAALAGERDAERLYLNAGKQVVIAVPVLDSAERQVLGVLILSAIAPTLTTVLGDQIPTLGVSLLCFTLFAGLIGMLVGFVAARGLVQRFDRLAEATLAWSRGDFSVSVSDPAGDELGQLAQRLNHMAQQLEQLLSTRRELAAVEERNRLARELHDSVKQQAFAAAAQISAAKMLLERDPAAAEAHVEQVERLIYDLRQELTTLIQELRPAALEGKGLASALREYAADWSGQNEIELEVRVQGERSLSLDVEQAVFRIVQEALANVARHSEASSAEIGLIYTKLAISCTVSDDGLGFDPHQEHAGFGLRSMQERASALGGALTVESASGAGTRISLTVPLGESPES
ncbi:MAG: histidine kinase, partial [Anaerolineae bacterium]|jgi:NarL family two-component system sensor histidine kinase LiaS